MNTLKDENTQILYGKWRLEDLNHILNKVSQINDTGQRIALISKMFLDIDYKEETLVDDVHTPEVFIVNLEGMDCMTFIEYVEAMQGAGSFHKFKENLKMVRYKDGKVAFENRNHFFTDWIESNSMFIKDATDEIGIGKTIVVNKKLNLKNDGSHIITGIPCKDRNIRYIPSDALDDTVIEKLNTGDYIGIYSKEDGLDVSHAGIVIRKGETVYIRHASSFARKVKDDDFKNYIAKKEGVIVLRHY